MNELMILDSHALMYRAYFAMQKQNLSFGGCPTGAIYGYLQYLQNILNTYNPENIVAVMDSGTPNFRHELYPDYKKGRGPMPSDLVRQVPIIHTMLHIHGITVEVRKNLEADDIIATLTHRFVSRGFSVRIVSKDKDLMQLIGPNVKMYSPNGTGVFEYIDEEYVVKKFGVTPTELTDYLALVGDTSDNIPGVNGIGAKTAVSLIKQGNIPHSYEEYILSKKFVTLRNIPHGYEDYILSKKLVTLRNYSEVTNSFYYKKGETNKEQLKMFLEFYGLKSFMEG